MSGHGFRALPSADRFLLPERLPTLLLLARPRAEIRAQAERLAAPVGALLRPHGFAAGVCDCESQIGSGALPTDTLPSAGLALTGAGGDASDRLSARLRGLETPVVGRIHAGALILDLGCLERDGDLTDALAGL